MQPTDLSGDIAQQAVEPINSVADGNANTGRPVADLIAADRYLAAKAAMRRRRRGLLFTKLTPPPAFPGGGPPCGGGFGGL